MDKWTVKKLQAKCKRDGLNGYSKMRKAELYSYCVENNLLDKPQTKSPVKEVSIKKTISKPSPKKRLSKWDVCVSSPSHAYACIEILSELYPEIVKNDCKPVIPGPAAALIVDNKKIVGITTPEGEIEAVVPPIPPPPPPPPLPFGHKHPYAPIIPTVKVSKDPQVQKALKEDLEEKKFSGEIVKASELQEQLRKLKKVTEEEKKLIQVEKKLSKAESHRLALESAVKKKTFKKTVDVEAERERRLEELRRREEARRPQILKDIEKGSKLKRVERCDYNMIYEPRLKKFVPVKQEVTEVQVEKAIDKTIEKMETQKECGCAIM